MPINERFFVDSVKSDIFLGKDGKPISPEELRRRKHEREKRPKSIREESTPPSISFFTEIDTNEYD